MTDPPVTRYTLRDHAALITLASPATRNALSAAMVSELIAQLQKAHADDAVRAVVITGEGSAFCAGADLRARGDMGQGEQSAGNPFVELLKLIRYGEKPVIVAVNGAAFGGGLGLVAAADIAIAADGVKLSFSEVRIGVIPAMISVVVLPKLGEHHTMRLFLTGERFSAAQARDYGLLHRVVPASELISAAFEDVAAIVKGGPNAVRGAKELVRTVARLSEDDAFAYAERVIAEHFASDEAAEGIAAFLQKRPPRWAAP